MGKKHLRNLKQSTRTSEGRDFKTMSDQIMSEQKRYRKPSVIQGEKDHSKPDGNKFTEKKVTPKSKTGDFSSLLTTITTDICDAYSDDGIKVVLSQYKKKEKDGILTAKVDFYTDSGDRLESNKTIMIYYMENRSNHNRRNGQNETYPAHLILVAQQTGAVLFSRFGYADDLIEKSEEYVRSIIGKTVNFFAAKDEAVTPPDKADQKDEVNPESMDGEETEPVE